VRCEERGIVDHEEETTFVHSNNVLGLEGRLIHVEASDHRGTCCARRVPRPERGGFAIRCCSGLTVWSDISADLPREAGNGAEFA
jgi:hypothetical protein